jgi:hypothetical protein
MIHSGTSFPIHLPGNGKPQDMIRMIFPVPIKVTSTKKFPDVIHAGSDIVPVRLIFLG